MREEKGAPELASALQNCLLQARNTVERRLSGQRASTRHAQFASLTPSPPSANESQPAGKKKKRSKKGGVASAADTTTAVSLSTTETLDPSEASFEAQASSLIASMTPAQRQALQRRLYALQADTLRVKYGPKERKMSLARAIKKVLKQKALDDISAHEPMIRKKSRAEVMKGIPGYKLRQGAEKMQLRPSEEALLPLDLFGKYAWERPGKKNWLGRVGEGTREFAFGIFGRCKQAEAVLRDRWAGKNPADVLVDQRFYDDIMDNAHKIELTLMLSPAENLPLAASRDTVVSRLRHTLRRTNPDAQEPSPEMTQNTPSKAELMVNALAHNYSGTSLKQSGLLDGEGRIAKGSKFILSVGRDYQLTAEAITPGILKDQRPVFLGHWEEPNFTRAVFEQFLGRYPISYQGKAQIGQGALYVANGFRFQPCGNANQFVEGDLGEPDFAHPADHKCEEHIGEIVPADLDFFDLSGEGPKLQQRGPLLNGIRQRRRLLGLA